MKKSKIKKKLRNLKHGVQWNEDMINNHDADFREIRRKLRTLTKTVAWLVLFAITVILLLTYHNNLFK